MQLARKAGLGHAPNLILNVSDPWVDSWFGVSPLDMAELLVNGRLLKSPSYQEFRCYRAAGAFHRGGARRDRWYPSDTTDAQWAVLDRLLPDPAWPAGQGGRPEVHCDARFWT